MRPKYLVTIIFLLALTLPVSPAHAAGIVSICDEAHLLAALAGGGTVTFSCSGTITLSATITIAAATTLHVGGPDVTISGNHAVRLFYVPTGSSLSLRNLTLAGGQAINGSGGAIYNEGSLVVADSTFESNAAAFHGGAIVNYGTLDVSDSVFLRNEAGINGGAIDSTVQLSVLRSSFTENSAGVRGGAINNYLGTLTVEDGWFERNRSAGYGGGLVNDGGGALIRASFMVGNAAQGVGGGIKNSGVLDVLDSTFSDNSAGTRGGGIDNTSGEVDVSNSTFSDNRAEGGGGGIENSNDSIARLSNSTFSLNWSQVGGGIHNNGGALDVSNSTFSGNSASGGGGISNYSTLTLKNTIVANSPTGGNCNSYSPITNGGGNLSFGDTTCPGLHGDPRLGPLQNNGGPTQTMALSAGSAAIDAGVDATCAAAPVNNLDQRGVTRPQGPHCDIGAYEFTVQPRRVFLSIIRRTSPPPTP